LYLYTRTLARTRICLVPSLGWNCHLCQQPLIVHSLHLGIFKTDARLSTFSKIVIKKERINICLIRLEIVQEGYPSLNDSSLHQKHDPQVCRRCSVSFSRARQAFSNLLYLAITYFLIRIILSKNGCTKKLFKHFWVHW